MLLRSVLFAPATLPDVADKLARSAPDIAVIDLEDAVPESGKSEGRAAAAAALDRFADGGPPMFVRINPVGSPWWREDAALAAHAAVSGVVVPKLERPGHVEALAKQLRAEGVERPCVVAGIETARGVLDVRRLLRAPVAAVYFGAEDLIADVGGRRTEDGDEVLFARSQVALAARVAGLAAIDQAVVALGDEERFRSDAATGAALGYTGKLCIHPSQVAWANRAFEPTAEEVDRSRRLLAAYEAAARNGAGAVRFEGQMVDAPMVEHARRLLAASQAKRASV
jgi:citrate lyase subunit beta / citryl-CoA lyase